MIDIKIKSTSKKIFAGGGVVIAFILSCFVNALQEEVKDSAREVISSTKEIIREYLNKNRGKEILSLPQSEPALEEKLIESIAEENKVESIEEVDSAIKLFNKDYETCRPDSDNPEEKLKISVRCMIKKGHETQLSIIADSDPTIKEILNKVKKPNTVIESK